jgi:hypothetical protein
MQRKKVFISSVQSEFATERQILLQGHGLNEIFPSMRTPITKPFYRI